MEKTGLIKKVLIPCLVGNALEFYDFTLCGAFLAVLGKNFFPSDSEFAALVGGIFAFSAAFFTRPLGALLFGYIGDKYGRKNALTFSVFLMGFPTLIIGLLPGYQIIGIWAPCILLLCRLLQGLCTGGEYNGAAIFALEHMKAKPGLISGLISASCVVGAITATFVAFFVTTYLQHPQSWRIPFCLGALVAVVGYILRKKALETEDFITKETIERLPILEVFKNYRRQYFLAVSSGAFNGILSYTLFGFLNIYLTKYIGLEVANSLFFNMFGLLAFMGTCVYFGGLADKITAHVSMKLAGEIAIITSWIGFFILQQASDLAIVSGQIVIGVGVGCFVGPSHYFLQQQFSPQVRYTGVASGFSIGMALTGGSTAFIMTYALESTHFFLAPAIYITFAAILWLLILNSLGNTNQDEPKEALDKAA